MSGNNGTLFSYVDLPTILSTHGSIGNPIIPDTEKNALWPFYSLNLKHVYKFVVNQNYSEFIIESNLQG